MSDRRSVLLQLGLISAVCALRLAPVALPPAPVARRQARHAEPRAGFSVDSVDQKAIDELDVFNWPGLERRVQALYTYVGTALYVRCDCCCFVPLHVVGAGEDGDVEREHAGREHTGRRRHSRCGARALGPQYRPRHLERLGIAALARGRASAAPSMGGGCRCAAPVARHRPPPLAHGSPACARPASRTLRTRRCRGSSRWSTSSRARPRSKTAWRRRL